MIHTYYPSFRLSVFTRLAVWGVALAAICAAQAGAEPAKHLGVASCSSSNCHGSTSPRKGDVLQNEFTTWFRHGQHSKAWKVLLDPDAQKIGKNLGMSSPEKEPLCLSCHATYVPDKSLQGDKYTVEDGVSCESCHGAAEHWITSHTAKDSSHADNISKGMAELTPLDDRAKLCLSCHYGTEDKAVNHRLIGAGHPRLSFELDTFSMIQPRHWEVDQDYIDRKAKYISAKAWLVGQVTLSEEVIEALASKKRSRSGMWPELTLFTCYSCHHSLKEDQWKVRDYDKKPGELYLNLSSLWVVSHALNAVNPDLSSKLAQLLRPLHDLYKSGEASEQLSRISRFLSGDVTKALSSLTYSDQELLKLLRAMSTYATTPHFQYEDAEQILMGMSSILASSPDLQSRYGDDLKDLYTALRDDEAFVAEDFTTAANTFRKRIH
ncbi:MAG: hypothetical protein KDD64_07470 [Bdellovibrionales bacterium]|nr:hypothetical protein [Bdellovibrionales bacterium]